MLVVTWSTNSGALSGSRRAMRAGARGMGRAPSGTSAAFLFNRYSANHIEQRSSLSRESRGRFGGAGSARRLRAFGVAEAEGPHVERQGCLDVGGPPPLA